MTKEDFAEWVASEIFSDDWEVNKNSFEEIACRKLVKLGIVEQIDGHYRLNNERENKKMTKEKAIKAIKEKYRDPEYIDELIKVLEQEPCEDYISRQMAINSLGECPMNWMDSDAEIVAERDWKDTVNMLNSLPSVTPQLKSGKWVDTGSGQECSECHEIQHGYDNFRRFCAYCGAQMIESEEKK